MSACICNCGSGLLATIGTNVLSSGIFLCLCLLGTYVFGWWFGLSWPWEKAKRKAMVDDLEAANLKSVRRRRDSVEGALGREVVMAAIAEDRHQGDATRLKKKISDLRKELEEAKAMGFVSESGLGAAGPSTVRKRNPS
ncbi:unnamed protein product [Alternaria burnsii]|nr:unnamed protein product [Alternaria burnsii]